MIADTSPIASRDTAGAPHREARLTTGQGQVAPTQIKILANYWNRVCQVNLWHAVDGRMVGESQGTHDSSEFHQRIWKSAEALAEKIRCEVGPMDMRNAATMLTIGKVKAPADMSLPEFTRLMTFYSLLINPEDQNALSKWRA